MSSEFFKKFLLHNQMTAEFFKLFDQNTVGKLQRQIHPMTAEFFKNFDQNSGWK